MEGLNSRTFYPIFTTIPITSNPLNLKKVGERAKNDTASKTKLAQIIIYDDLHHYHFAWVGFFIYFALRKYLVRYKDIILAALTAVVIEEHAVFFYEAGLDIEYLYLSQTDYKVIASIALILLTASTVRYCKLGNYKNSSSKKHNN